MSQLNYRTELTTKKCKTEKLKKDMLRSNSKHVWGIHIISPEEEKESCGGKDLQKRNVLSPE